MLRSPRLWSSRVGRFAAAVDSLASAFSPACASSQICFSQYASDRARDTHGTLMRCPLRCRTRGDRSTSHVFRAGGGLCCHRAVPHRCLSFVRLGGEFCRPQRIRSVTCAARLPDEWEASPGGARMHVHCLNRICGVDLRYGSTADQGRIGREDSTSRSWHPARVVGTHA